MSLYDDLEKKVPTVHLLWVEDNQDVLNGVSRLLETFPGKIILHHTDNSEEALQMFKDLNPDGVILDWFLQDTKGQKDTLQLPELYKKLRSLSNGVPITVITAYTNEKDVQELSKKDGIHILGKPVDQYTLKILIREIRIKKYMEEQMETRCRELQDLMFGIAEHWNEPLRKEFVKIKESIDQTLKDHKLTPEERKAAEKIINEHRSNIKELLCEGEGK